jgi:hypothetical protein
MSTQDAAAETSASPLHRFASSEVVASASLEVNFTWPQGDTRVQVDRLRAVLHHLQWFTSEGKSDVLLLHPGRTAEWTEALSPDFLMGVWGEFASACEIPIRTHMATLRLQRNVAGDPAVRFADVVRLTAARNVFPDDPVVFTVHASSTEPDAWLRLAQLRGVLVEDCAERLLWATLGYGFVTNTLEPRVAGPAMEDLCMRYVGVDLEDVFGAYAALAERGMRSINWQAWASEWWVKAKQQARAAEGITEVDGILRWQTGPQPSLCDRNDMQSIPSLVEYAALGERLAGLMFELRTPWLPRWNADTASRWCRRWSEIQH